MMESPYPLVKSSTRQQRERNLAMSLRLEMEREIKYTPFSVEFPEMRSFDIGPNKGLVRHSFWNWVRFRLFGDLRVASNGKQILVYRQWHDFIYVTELSANHPTIP